jgi:hypothetical protein
MPEPLLHYNNVVFDKTNPSNENYSKEFIVSTYKNKNKSNEPDKESYHLISLIESINKEFIHSCATVGGFNLPSDQQYLHP